MYVKIYPQNLSYGKTVVENHLRLLKKKTEMHVGKRSSDTCSVVGEIRSGRVEEYDTKTSFGGCAIQLIQLQI